MTVRFPNAAIVLAFSVSAAPAMSTSFTWGPTVKGFDSGSSPISLSNVPKGTARLRFRMVGLNAVDYNHGGGTVSHSGKNNLPCGAVRRRGPCPPARNTFEFRGEALDASGRVLAPAMARMALP
jgi:hypothetical protein